MRWATVPQLLELVDMAGWLAHPVEPGESARYRCRCALLEAEHRISGEQLRRVSGGTRKDNWIVGRRPERMVRDVPRAAQLLALITRSLKPAKEIHPSALA